MAVRAAALSLLGLLAVLALAKSSEAHGGHFHAAPGPKSRGDLRSRFKRCSDWTILPAAKDLLPTLSSIKNFGEGAPDAFRPELSYYLNGNCSSRASINVEFNFTMSSNNSEPIANVTMMGMVMTNLCNQLSRPSAGYYPINATGNLTSPSNYVWFMQGTTNAAGNLNGHAANNGLWREVPSNQRSFVLFHVDKANPPNYLSYDAMRSSAIACCQFPPAYFPSWFRSLQGKGKKC